MSSRGTSAGSNTIQGYRRELFCISKAGGLRAAAKKFRRAATWIPQDAGRSDTRGDVPVGMAALDQLPQPVARQFESVIQFVDILGPAGQFSRVNIRDEFVAKIRPAANA